jgi:short-subunit dehydrogenase
MTDPFRDQGFIVTGAASGMGLATSRLLRQRGARLALWDRSADALTQAAAELDALACPVEISDPAQVEQSASASLAHLGRLNGVVHAAGILRAGEFSQVDLAEHLRVMQVNLLGTVTAAYALLPYLRQTAGSLVMIASVSAFSGSPEYATYGAAKAGVLSFAEALRIEERRSRVHIGVVFPLFVATPMLSGYNGQTRMIRSRSIFFDTQPPEAIAPFILNGIARQQFMIFPGWRTRLLFLMSRYTQAAVYPITLMTYRQGGG